MANILVTGATGLLGSTLVPLLQKFGHKVTRLGFKHSVELNADLTSYQQTTNALNQVHPEVIINLAALTNVDRCEKYPQEAYLQNVKLVENICTWIRSVNYRCFLIQISSDQVYDGLGPHSEKDLTIRNHYAMSKLAGEFAAQTVPSTILRTNFIGHSLRKGRTSFTDWLYDALCGQVPIKVFEDVMFSPLSIHTVCQCIERCVVEQPLGIFNLGSHNGMSKADFAFAFAAATELPTVNLVRANSSDSTSLIAHRPTDMRMQCDQFESRMDIKLPQLIDEIRKITYEYSK